MIKIRQTKNIFEEAQFMEEQRLDYNLLKVLAGDRPGTKEEQEKIKALKKNRESNLYTEALYILTHKIIDDSEEAQELYQRIIEHRDHLSQQLSRKVGIEVAALDYMRNILSILNEPEIIEKSTISQIFKEAMIDEKTGAFGFGGLMLNLENEIERVKRYKRPFSLLFVDIDNFKTINDVHGHMTGDHVLRQMVKSINATLRSLDKVYRYGGDEMICLLPETGVESAKVVAQRIVDTIAKTPIDPDVKFTVSIGISQADPQRVKDAEDLIKEADEAMYLAKKTGKNRISTVGQQEDKP